MCEAVTVHGLQAFRDLKDNKASLILRQRFQNASVQIAELQVLHSKEDASVSLEPALEFDESGSILRHSFSSLSIPYIATFRPYS